MGIGRVSGQIGIGRVPGPPLLGGVAGNVVTGGVAGRVVNWASAGDVRKYREQSVIAATASIEFHFFILFSFGNVKDCLAFIISRFRFFCKKNRPFLGSAFGVYNVF